MKQKKKIAYNSKSMTSNTIPQPKGWFAKCSSSITATKSWAQFGFFMALAFGLSAIGLTDFTIAIDNDGWISRGTLIAKRSAQYWIINENFSELSTTPNNDDLWKKLTSEAQPNFSDVPTENDEDEVERRRSRKLLSSHYVRKTQEEEDEMACSDELFNDSRILSADYHLSPLWRTSSPDRSVFDPTVIEAICQAELNTMQILAANNLCVRDCQDDSQCLAPYSIVWFVRAQVSDWTRERSCADLASAWSDVRTSVEDDLVTCVSEIKETYTTDGSFDLPESCPEGFSTTLVEEQFDTTRVSQHTISIFPTEWNGDETVEKLYDLVDDLDHGVEGVVEGAYDNQRESLGVVMTDMAVQSDMILAMASGAITTVAILLHTRSPWITLIGLLQIILSFPTSYFIYTFVFGLTFFPFLNFIGVFVVFALGADDVFVAMDKWKNARLDYPTASTREIAAIALPDAAGAMLLTTTTTAVAFFATAICPVAPLKCFAIFCGLLIVLDYLWCILLVFPALCIYDKSLLKAAAQEKNHLCCNLSCKKQTMIEEEEENAITTTPPAAVMDDSAHAAHIALDDENNQSLIRRILLGYYAIFHKLRWIIFIACLVGTVVAGIFAARLELPKDSEVRLLGPDVEYEKAFFWRQELLQSDLDKSSGSPQALVWGAEPADNGSYVDPKSGSTLVLDESFDPAQAQDFLLNFCEDFFNQDFAARIAQEFKCPMNELDEWLSANAANTYSDAYTQHCNGATGLPMPVEDFHACAGGWSMETSSPTMLHRNGESIVAIFFYYTGRVRFDSPFNALQEEYAAIEKYLYEDSGAPSSASNMFAASIDFWWYDTNGSMLRSAYQSAGIALSFSGLVVLLSSRSFVLTLFALLTISYVLASTTAMLVATGWTLGFLESICFAILIGISCDFVLHFCHAYAHLKGNVSREVRTQYALLRMGPSILAAAVTTVCAAAIMLFTVVSFFQQFATILFYTIIQATIGSFVVFTAFADCIGPSNPTALFDRYLICCNSSSANATTTAAKDITAATSDEKVFAVSEPQQQQQQKPQSSNYNSGMVYDDDDESDNDYSC